MKLYDSMIILSVINKIGNLLSDNNDPRDFLELFAVFCLLDSQLITLKLCFYIIRDE